MKRFLPLLSLIAFPFLILSLSDAQDPLRKSRIVPAGSETAGKTLFVEKGCYQCHTANEIKLPTAELDDMLLIDLGGDEHNGWTRDDFAKAIMNPNHTVNPDYEKAMMILGDHFKAVNSPMPGFNDILTVSDMIHLTTFLDSLTD